jgi:molybdopterin-guanine dinucleotide biosynthesis protein MobB
LARITDRSLPLAAILAGGQSRRFGAPKPFADLLGTPLIAWVRDAVGHAVPEPVLIANDPDAFAGLGLQVRPDTVLGSGPLGGLHAALRWAHELDRPAALCVACDTPFLPPALLRCLVREFQAGNVDVVAPESHGPLGVEPLCAVYSVACLAHIERCLSGGRHALGDLLRPFRQRRLPLDEVRSYGEPTEIFFNVNTPEQHEHAIRIAQRMSDTSRARPGPPAVSIVGRKNSGKTTLVVAVAAELKSRGYRVASVKHGHHAFEIDQPGRDSWRHFHEGEVEAVLLVAAGKLALVMRSADEEFDPELLIRRFYGTEDYDVVLIEGYKSGPFPKIEVLRSELHPRPVYDPADSGTASRFLAIVSDDSGLAADVPVIPLDVDLRGGAHVCRVADLIEEQVIRGGRGAG